MFEAKIRIIALSFVIPEPRRQLRIRAHVLREQVRHEDPAEAPEPAQGRGVFEAAAGLQILLEGVRRGHAGGPSRQVRARTGRVSQQVRRQCAGQRGAGHAPQGGVHRFCDEL